MTNRLALAITERLARPLLRGLCAVGFAVTAGAVSAAPSIQYVATDLVDLVAGQDLWQYDYTIAGDVAAGDGVNILFAYSQFDGIDVLLADSAVFATPTQPVSVLSADGLLSITALQQISSADPAHISVQFQWLASGSPGAQQFEVVDSFFSVVDSGTTVSPSAPHDLPEPSSAWLAGVALAGVLIRRRSNAIPFKPSELCG
ncbi:MAG: PEP-CTERM sorting domain-containing protein [Burkholderiales bacterium]|nr:PEP-CTERM sorting domain-containing protein [Burkholderiales bacterium]